MNSTGGFAFFFFNLNTSNETLCTFLSACLWKKGRENSATPAVAITSSLQFEQCPF